MTTGAKIVQLRTARGLSQEDLAEKSGLSIRTIQRIEVGENVPRGHTLRALAQALNTSVEMLAGAPMNTPTEEKNNTLYIELINLSALSFFILPFGNVILPALLWYRKRGNQEIDETARRILNFQLLWTIATMLALIITPFIQSFLTSQSEGKKFPAVLLVFLVAFGLNIVFIGMAATRLRKGNRNIFNIGLRIL